MGASVLLSRGMWDYQEDPLCLRLTLFTGPVVAVVLPLPFCTICLRLRGYRKHGLDIHTRTALQAI